MPAVVRFDCFQVDLAAGQLFKRGAKVRLRDQSFQVLAALVESPGQVVTREDLRRRLWPDDVHVDFDNSLNTAIARLREVLNDSAARPRFIETLPRRGYRFVGMVLEVDPPAADVSDLTSGHKTIGRPDAARKITRDPIAYSEYVQGRRYLDGAMATREDAARARGHFERAVARDPDFALAYEALAQLYWFQGYFGLIAPRDAFATGIFHAVRALEIDNGSAETHALLAQFHKQLDYNWPAIERELRAALDLNPNSSFVRWVYAFSWLMPQGRIQDAIVEVERALERDPVSVVLNVILGVMVSLAREWDRVIEQGRLISRLDPLSPWGPWILSGGCRGTGLLDEAVAAQRRAVELSGGTAMMLGWFGLTLGMSGRADEARAVLDRLQTKAQSEYVPPTSFAWVHVGLRDVDTAFKWLDRAIDGRDQFMMAIKTYAFFDPIRSDPRFEALLRKMNL